MNRMMEALVNRSTLLLIVSIGFITDLTVGCTSPAPLRNDYGRSVEAMKRAQRPDAASAQGIAPMEGLDGRAAQAVIQNYLDTFDKGKTAGQSQALIQPPAGFTEAIGASGLPPGGVATGP